jgi:hypothetical protein
MRDAHIIVNGGSSQVQTHAGISRRDRDVSPVTLFDQI